MEEIKEIISLTDGNIGGSIQILQNDNFEDQNFEEYQAG